MKTILTAEQMRFCDAAQIEKESSLTLMERAAHRCADAMRELLNGKTDARVFVLCGGGNNGGDGIAAARFLSECGIRAEICLLCNGTLSVECEWQKQLAKEAGIPFVNADMFTAERYSAVLDALFGIGMRGTITGQYAEIIEKINESGLPVLAVDIPSGISADTGHLCGCAIRASHTVTMAFAKPGHYLGDGKRYTGKLTVADIGIPDTLPAKEMRIRSVEDADIPALLPARDPYGNKGTFGRVLVCGGSRNMSGAAYFSAKAAYRVGAGLVQLLTPACNRTILQTLLPEAILTTYGDGETGLTQTDRETVADAVSRADTVVIGPGIGQSETARQLLETVLSHVSVPTVIDADALRMLAVNPALYPKNGIPLILTPHPGELSALTGIPIPVLLDDFIENAVAFTQKLKNGYGVCAVLCAKDAHTVVTDGAQVYLNQSGSSALAKGGSGDVLTGILAGLLAAGKNDVLTAAAVGVHIHGRAGEYAADTCGVRGVLASETADAAAMVLKTLCNDNVR